MFDEILTPQTCFTEATYIFIPPMVKTSHFTGSHVEPISFGMA